MKGLDVSGKLCGFRLFAGLSNLFDQFRETVKRAGFYWLLINQPLPAIVPTLPGQG